MAINLAGFLYSDNGTAIQSASITLIDSGGNTEATTTTNSSGYWSFAEADEDVYDIKIQSGSQIRYVKGLDKITLSEIDVRNSAANSTGAFTFTNSTNNASNKVGTFRSLNSTRADGDEIYLSFNLVNDNAEETEFARITAEANDVSNGSEDGEIRFSVMKAGTLTEVWNLNSSTAGATSMDMNVDSFTIGAGGDTDITLTFDANSNDGVITWMEDEDYFAFSDEILMNSTEKLLFGDTGTFIHQSSDGVLTITSDTTVDINGAVVFDGALSGITTLGASGVITAGGLTIGSAVIVEAELEMIDGITAGTAAANKAVVLDGSKNIATIGTIGSAAITSTGTSSFGSGTTIGNLTLANGSITDSGGALDFGNETLTTTGAVDFGAATVDSLSVSDANITNVADIALDSISADGTDINIAVSDNSATALTIKQGSDAYLIVDTANSSESVSIGTGISGTAITLGHSTSEVTVADNLTITGDLTVSGTTTTVNSTTVTVDDPIFTLGGDSDPGSDDNKDRGIEFRYHDGSSARVGFFGFDDSTGKFTTLTAATNSSEVFSGTAMPAIFGNIEGAAISGTTGTFTGVMDITDTTDSSDATGDTGALRTEGGASIAKKLYVGTDLDVDGTTNLDAVDIDGAVQIDSTITVGANDQGYDIIFYGDTASANMTWDTSADDLIFNGGAGLIVPEGQFTLGSTALGSTAGELNLLDGSAKSTSSITIDNADAFIVIDGNTTKQIPASDIKTYAASATAADDIGTGDGAVNLVTTSGNITIDAQANDADVIIKVDDNGSAVTAVTFDGSAEGDALFVNNINVPGEVMTTKVSFTDGDDAMTIVDGGAVTFPVSIDITGSAGIILENDETITNSTNGTISFSGGIAIPDAGNIGSASDLDAIAISSGGVVTFSQAVTADAGVEIDNITIDGTEIDLSSGDLTLDVAGDIILDAAGANVLPGGDNTTDLGATATRWRTMYGQQFHMDSSADGIADHDYAGISITVRVGDGANVGAFDLVCISDETNEVQVADADAIATSRVIGINPSNSAISDNSEGTILLFGIVRDDSWNWSIGQTLYLGTGGTGSTITATAPSGTDDCVVPIGIALEADMIYFNPSQTVIEHA